MNESPRRSTDALTDSESLQMSIRDLKNNVYLQHRNELRKIAEEMLALTDSVSGSERFGELATHYKTYTVQDIAHSIMGLDFQATKFDVFSPSEPDMLSFCRALAFVFVEKDDLYLSEQQRDQQ